MSGGRSWTTGEVRRLRQMRAERFSTKDIAAELGRTVDAIYSFLRYVPAQPPKPASLKPIDRINVWSSEELQALRNMAAEGATTLEAARLLHRTPTAVRSIASRERIRFTGSGKHTVFRLERETDKFRRDAAQGSKELLSALLRLSA